MTLTAPIVELASQAARFSWRGRPLWRSAAIRIWRVRLAAAWFALVMLDGIRLALVEPADRARIIAGAGPLALAALGACGLLLLLAWLTRKTTEYAIGEGGVLLRYGIAIRATVEIPYCAIESVEVRVLANGSGDISLRPKQAGAVAYLKLWPHVRLGAGRRVQPMLRCVPAAGAVAARLTREIEREEALRRAALERASPPPLSDPSPLAAEAR